MAKGGWLMRLSKEGTTGETRVWYQNRAPRLVPQWQRPPCAKACFHG